MERLEAEHRIQGYYQRYRFYKDKLDKFRDSEAARTYGFTWGSWEGKPIRWIPFSSMRESQRLDHKRMVAVRCKAIDVVSLEPICARPFRLASKSTKWTDSDLRSWLNNEFYQNAFTDSHRDYIIPLSVPGTENREYYEFENQVCEGKGADKPTRDHIYILPLSHVKANLNLRYCVSKESLEESRWLRNAGRNNSYAAVIWKTTIVPEGVPINQSVYVHPAMSVALDESDLVV